MTTLHEIEGAISDLSPNELARFRAWFEDFDATLWDKQFEDDAKTGNLDTFADKAVSDFKAGRFKEL